MTPPFNRRTLAAAVLGALALAVLAGAFSGGRATAAESSTPLSPPAPGIEEATFASGCFWCTEKDFDEVAGVVETISGYTGGRTANPTYYEVGSGTTGHTEALLVRFDPKRVSYRTLLDHYWRNVDLVDGGGQFCDRGSQYRPAIFTHGPEQARAAAESKAALEQSGRFKQPIAVSIEPEQAFTPAEDYHQDYYKKNPVRYKYYRNGCGRDARLNQLWPERTSQ